MQKKRIPETEYLYSSARVRALEGTLIGADKLEAAMAAKSTRGYRYLPAARTHRP